MTYANLMELNEVGLAVVDLDTKGKPVELYRLSNGECYTLAGDTVTQVPPNFQVEHKNDPKPEPIGQMPIVQCNTCKNVEYGEPSETEQEFLHRLRDDRFWDLEGDMPTCSGCEIAADATGGLHF